MDYVIHYDISALILTSVLSVCYYFKHFIPNLKNKIFLLLLYMVNITTLVDLADALGTMNVHLLPMWYHYLTSYLFFFLLNILPALYTLYIIAATGTQSKLRQGISVPLFFIPLATLALILILNPFLGWLFQYDASGAYFRGPALYVLYGIAFYYLFYGIFIVFKYRDIIRPGKRIALCSFFPLVAIPSIIQIFFPAILIEMLGASVCMMLTFLTIQNPDELLCPQTRLFNRTALRTQATVAFRTGREFSVISACITRFDYLERTFGDTLISEILREISHGLGQLSLRNKELYYIGSGQFIILLPVAGMYPPLTGQIRDILEGGSRANRMEVTLTAHVVAFQCPQEAQSTDFLLEYLKFLSDRREGAAVITTLEQAQHVHRRVLAIERAVENALLNGGFEVYYQPIFSVKDNRVNSAEALLRLKDPELGFIPPDEFIPITERNGSIIEIGMFVFRSVCKFMAEHDLKCIGIEYIEINLSVEQCMQRKLADQLLNVIDEYHLPADCINLEITETAVSYSTETLEYNMNALAQTGFKFSLDDYGTGYSNMSSMVRLPFHLVKIDKGIVSAMADERTFIAISSTIAMFKEMRMGIVAEGVETLEQVEVLSALGCDYLQGYYFSRPVPGDEFLTACHSRQRVLIK